MLRLIQEEKATGMTLVPTMANALLNCPDLGKYDTSSMREITTGRRRVVPRVDRAAWSRRSIARYVAATASPKPVPWPPRRSAKGTVHYADEADRLNRLAAAGWPLLGSEVRVVDLKCATCRATCRPSAKW